MLPQSSDLVKLNRITTVMRPAFSEAGPLQKSVRLTFEGGR